MPSDTDLLGSVEAAGILGVDKATVTRWANQGRLRPAAKIPGLRGPFVFTRGEVERVATERLATAEAVR